MGREVVAFAILANPDLAVKAVESAFGHRRRACGNSRKDQLLMGQVSPAGETACPTQIRKTLEQ
jgi:hypothetical protein